MDTDLVGNPEGIQSLLRELPYTVVLKRKRGLCAPKWEILARYRYTIANLEVFKHKISLLGLDHLKKNLGRPIHALS
jgi:hypothetical protein